MSDPIVVASRREVFMPSPVIFTTARGSCIRMGGDLASIISSTDMNNTATLVGSRLADHFYRDFTTEVYGIGRKREEYEISLNMNCNWCVIAVR